MIQLDGEISYCHGFTESLLSYLICSQTFFKIMQVDFTSNTLVCWSLKNAELGLR